MCFSHQHTKLIVPPNTTDSDSIESHYNKCPKPNATHQIYNLLIGNISPFPSIYVNMSWMKNFKKMHDFTLIGKSLLSISFTSAGE